MAFIPMIIENAFSPSCPFRGRDNFRSERCRGIATDLPEDVRNAIAIVQAMFDPEHPTGTRSTHQQKSKISVTVDKDKFQANFDVQHFKPEEITVKITGDRTVTIEAKHEEKQDEHGQIYRHFIRKYVLPENCDVGQLESKLSSDGVLTILAPIRVSAQVITRTIPISLTGQSATVIKPQNKPQEKSAKAKSTGEE